MKPRNRGRSGLSTRHRRVRRLLIVIVVGIGVVLTIESWLSIEKFGLGLLAHADLGPGGRRIRRAAVHLGDALFLDPGAPHGDPGRSRHRRLHLRTVSRAPAQPLVFLTELLAAIPSIVYGLWGIFVLVPAMRTLEIWTPAVRQLPLFSGPPVGVGMLAAGLILAIMVIPFTSSVAREVLKAVPIAQREGAYALGATRFEAIQTALFYARTGIVGAVMLGFGRALGETMAVTMVIGNTRADLHVAVRTAVHDGRCHRQRVHRGRHRPLPERAGRDRPGAVRHHADHQRDVARADLEHDHRSEAGAALPPAAAEAAA